MKKKTLLHGYDSNEELYFSWYLDELYEAGYISEYEWQPKQYVLSEAISYEYDKHLKTKTKTIIKKLMQGHIYSPDYKINWNKNARGFFFLSISDQLCLKNIPFIAQETEDGWNNYMSIVEVKPAFDRNNMTRLFTINQKWMYQKHGMYVQKIIPVKLFERTFTPKRYLQTDRSGKPRKLKYKPKSLEEYLCLQTQK